MKLFQKIVALLIIIMLMRCAFNNEIRTFQELSKHNTGGSIQIVTLDTSVYFVEDYFYTDSILSVQGKKSKHGKDSLFNGKLLFEDIAYIQTSEAYFFPSLAYLGLNIFICANAASLLQEPSKIEPIIKFASDGSSCPYVYSWNGHEYFLEGEGFGTALGKALEIESSMTLNNLDMTGSEIKLKITNERPETHFINNIELYGFEMHYEEKLYHDNSNNFYAVKEAREILSAVDIHDRDITELLRDEDEIYWCSDLRTAELDYNFEDQLIIKISNVENSDSISLIISAINTEIFNVVFEYLQKLLGENYVNFLKAAETDPELISILKSALERSSLKIDIWNGNKWQYVDLIYPQANFVKFSKIARIPVLKNNDDQIKLRLRCLTDVWQLDAVHFSEKSNRLKYACETELVKVESNADSRIDRIKNDDNLYLKLLPGEYLNLEYNNYKPKENKKISYGLKIKGYLYEWLIDKGYKESIVEKALAYNSRVELVKEILKDIDLILPIIYGRWSNVKMCYALNKSKNKVN